MIKFFAVCMAFSAAIVIPAQATPTETSSPAGSTRSIPAELARFKERYEAVMAKKDLDALGDMVAPGFLHNGRDKERMIEYFKSFTPFINSYKMEIVKYRHEKKLVLVDYKITTDMATTEHSVPFKLIGGELYFYGNQRPMNPDGSIGKAPRSR